MDGSTRRAGSLSRRLAIEVLEDRLVLSGATFLPNSVSLGVPAAIASQVAAMVVSVESGSRGDSDADDVRPVHLDGRKLREYQDGDPQEYADGLVAATSFTGPAHLTPAHPSAHSYDQAADEEQEATERAAQEGQVTSTERIELLTYANASAGDGTSDGSRPILVLTGTAATLRSPDSELIALDVPRPVPTESTESFRPRALNAIASTPDFLALNPAGNDFPGMTLPVPSYCADPQLPQSKILPQNASDSESWHLPSEVFIPFAGALPLDLENLRDNLDTFFIRLAHLGDESADLSGSLAVTTWLVVATAVAFELARLRGRRPSHPCASEDAVAAELQIFTAKDES